MKYSKLIEKKKQYKYSANICFDLHNGEKIADFIPNQTTAEIIREYFGGMINGRSQVHSRILYGSYGTGKSHLLTVLSAIMGQINTKGTRFESFLSLIRKYDLELADDIKNYVNTEMPYLVVPVYSDFGDFGQCISYSVKKELNKCGLKVSFNGYFEEALVLLEKWINGEESSVKLRAVCKECNTTINDLKDGLSAYDSQYEVVFDSIYEGMSYGASFNCSMGNLIDNLNTANKAIADKYRGIIIVFDEFGRYVEDYGESIKVKAIQDLAEYCDHCDFSTYIILVSHKQLSMYTDKLKKSVSDEWKKVEGRFKATSINIKYDQCLSLIRHIIPKTNNWKTFSRKYENELNDLYNQAWDFKGFLLSPYDLDEENPFEGGYPLHPITLYALDRLSKKVAQNERTFFTYLAGDEDCSLFSQLEKIDTKEFHFIGLDSILDYFEVNILSYKTDDAYGIYKKFQYAISKLGLDNEPILVKILKAIAVIYIIGDTDVIIADVETLLNIIDEPKEKIANAIKELEHKKIIKFMRQYGYYNFFDSSIFDLEGMVEEKLTGISDDMVVTTLNERFADFVIYPYRYNSIYHVNRIFVPVFVRCVDLDKKVFKNSLPKFYDGVVSFVLDEDGEIINYSDKTLPERMLLLVNQHPAEIINEVRRFIAVQFFYSKQDELAMDDPTIVNELTMYLSEQEAIIRDLIRKWKRLEDSAIIPMVDGVVQHILSESDLTNSISVIMEKAFFRTPIINNDLLNKNTLSGAIRLARKKALQGIFSDGDMYENCSVMSPEHNILRSVLSKNGISQDGTVAENELNRFDDGLISGEPVMLAINSFLKKAEKRHMPLLEIYSELKNAPFGLRDGYMPVLFAFALKEHENVSLYFHGTEHDYSEEELIRALEEPENYTIYICDWNKEQSDYISALESIFSDFLPSGKSKHRLKELFLAMNTHYSSVSKSARGTERYVSDSTKKYRNILNVSYRDYNNFFFEKLPEINKDLGELTMVIVNVKKELEAVPNKLIQAVEKTIRLSLGLTDEEELVSTVREIYLTEWKDKSQRAFDYLTNSFLDYVSGLQIVEKTKFVGDMAKIITGFEVEYWTDSRINEFEEELCNIINRLNTYENSLNIGDNETKITIETGSGETVVSKFSQDELSVTGKMFFNKLAATIDSFGQAISYEEKIGILAEILKGVIGG